MILEFSFENFRSIKDKQVFSLVAESTKNKRDSNTFDVELGRKDKITLLKSAVVYGANASGKSNFIRAFNCLRRFIVQSANAEGNSQIKFYEPFLFNTETAENDTSFECIFILNNLKFSYTLAFNRMRVSAEELSYYPRNSKKSIFKRVVSDELTDTARFAKDIEDLEIDLKALPVHFRIYKNQAILSKFGSQIAESFLYKVYHFFSSWNIWETNTQQGINKLTQQIIADLIPVKGHSFFEKLERLIKVSDIKIDELVLKEDPEVYESRSSNYGEINRLFGNHAVYQKEKILSSYELPFIEESSGTKVLFALGAYILDVIEKGGVVIFDELDNSLHPKLSRFLVNLFNNNVINTKNAQIIFTTHEANLIDKDMFRSDQIWFTSKSDKGETEIYSAQDFEGVREDIPFDKWYLAGKFGALPNIQEMEVIFEDGK